MDEISIKDLIQINSLGDYKLHLACRNNDGISPLDEYVKDRNIWINWNKWKGNKNDWSRKYIFSLIEFYPSNDSWLFGGIFKIIKRESNEYILEECLEYKKYEGRLIINFHRYKGLRGRAYYLEKFFNAFLVKEILPKIYDGAIFPGYKNIDHNFSALQAIFQNEKSDWKRALINIKGVYLISDKSNGKKYVGSAYGQEGIWSRWSCYIGTGHGHNDQLTTLIKDKGIDHCRTNFKFSLLEVMLMNTPDEEIIIRESFWKGVLLSRGIFGYNSN